MASEGGAGDPSWLDADDELEYFADSLGRRQASKRIGRAGGEGRLTLLVLTRWGGRSEASKLCGFCDEAVADLMYCV